jgi:hypothetical protein
MNWNHHVMSTSSARNCQCHRDDPNLSSDYVKVEWWLPITTSTNLKKKHNLHSTEVMPRALLDDIVHSELPVPRAMSAPSDAATNHIMTSRETFEKSTLAIYHPNVTWTYANQRVRQWREAHHDPSETPDVMDLTEPSEPNAPL